MAASSWSWQARISGDASEEEDEEDEDAIAVHRWTTAEARARDFSGQEDHLDSGVLVLVRPNQREVFLAWKNSWGNCLARRIVGED